MAPRCSTVRTQTSQAYTRDAEFLRSSKAFQTDTPVKSRSEPAALSTLLCAHVRGCTLTLAIVLTSALVLFGTSFSCSSVQGRWWCAPRSSIGSVDQPSSSFSWLRASLYGASPPGLPADFDWRGYLKWNPEIRMHGVHTKEMAEEHYMAQGRAKSLVYRDYDLTIRYTACGGLMNQHYCHMATIALAHMAKANKIVWPPMQERKSFHIRYHPDATQNEQQWEYLDASTLWDLRKIQAAVKRAFGIKIVKHPDNVPMPDMTKLETAFQAYNPDYNNHDSEYEFKLRLDKPIYLARHNPHMLARAVMDAGRQVVLKHGRQPTSVLVDLPCTLFMLDNRNLPIIESIARLMTFSPQMMAIADKVVKGIAKEEGSVDFNGVHLRMERDAADWAMVLGGKEHYWETYLSAMEKAHFDKQTPLYVASGLLTGSTDINDPTKASADPESAEEMKVLVKDIIDHEFASKVVHKEMYLSQQEIDSLGKEQSGLIDFLVLRQSQYMVGISVSTFSFFLQELRLLDGHAQEDTVMFEAYIIGTDQMFHTSAVVATDTRVQMSQLGVLHNTCKTRLGKPC